MRIDAQIGLEPSPDTYVAALVVVFCEVRRVLKDDGTVWLNLGDSYAGAANSGGPNPNAGGGAAVRISGLQPKAGRPKDLIGIPWRVALALQADGWYLRSDIIWSKPNPMPESVRDRPTKAHEYLFLLSKSERYSYDAAAIRESDVDQGAHHRNDSAPERGMVEGIQKNDTHVDRRKHGVNEWDQREYAGKYMSADPEKSASRRLILSVKAARDNGAPHDQPFGNVGRNKRTVWTIPTTPYAGAHFATMPEKLVEPCIRAGCPLGGLVLDPFVGSGTVVSVAQRLGRRGVGVDLKYQDLAKTRTAQRGLRFAEIPV